METLTYEMFLQKLRATPRNWILTEHKEIRLKDDLVTCPGLVCGAFESSTSGGIQPRDLRWKIAAAADYSSTRDADTRRDLLEACGLQETI